MSKEKTLHVTRQEVACAKNGNGDTSNESNDVIVLTPQLLVLLLALLQNLLIFISMVLELFY